MQAELLSMYYPQKNIRHFAWSCDINKSIRKTRPFGTNEILHHATISGLTVLQNRQHFSIQLRNIVDLYDMSD